MSRESRLADASTRIMPPKDPATGRFQKRPAPPQIGGNIALNSARIPGGLGFKLPAPVTVAGIEWQPSDGHCFASPIGAALAAELAAAS